MEMRELWGGILASIDIDVVQQSVVMIVDVLDSGTSERHELRLGDVWEFRFFNSIEGPWNYADFTEIHLERMASHYGWIIDIVLWSEDAGISAKCGSVELNGTKFER